MTQDDLPTQPLPLPGGGATFGRFLKAFFGAGMIRAVGGVLLIVSGIVTARLLGEAQFGLYSYAMSWVMVLGVASSLGLKPFMTKETAACLSRRDWSHLRGLLVGGPLVAGGAGLIIGALAAGTAAVVGSFVGLRGWPVLAVAMAAVPLSAVASAAVGGLLGLHRVLLALLCEALVTPGLSLAVLVVAVAAGAPRTAMTAILSAAGALGVTVLLVGGLVRGHRPAELLPVRPKQDWPAWARGAAPLLVVSLLQIVNIRADGLMVGSILGTEWTGIYNISARLAELVVFPLLSINGVVAPTYARLHTEGSKAELQQLVTRSVRLAAVGGLLPAAGLMIFARWPLLLFGDGFVEGQTALRILAGCQLFNAAAGPVGVLLVSGGHGRVMAWALGSAVAVNLVLNAVLIPPLGMAGAALATGTSTIVWNGLLIVHVLRRLGIDPTVLGRSMSDK